jgi:hypothetical protein
VGGTTAGSSPVERGHDVVVRPRAALLRSTALSILFSVVPLTVALVWVSFPLRIWAVVASVVAVLAVVAVVVYVRFRTAYAGIGSDDVEVRGILTPSVRIDRASVHRVVIATTFGASVDRTTRHLLVLSDSGRTLLRMRSVLWDDSAIHRVAEGLDAQVTELRTPVSLREFHRRYPGSRAWYERTGPLVTIGTATVAVVALAIIAEDMGLIAG